MLGGKVEEGEQALPIGQQRFDRLGMLGLILGREAKPCGRVSGAALGVHHLAQRALGAGLEAAEQLVEYVGELVTPD